MNEGIAKIRSPGALGQKKCRKVNSSIGMRSTLNGNCIKNMLRDWLVTKATCSVLMFRVKMWLWHGVFKYSRYGRGKCDVSDDFIVAVSATEIDKNEQVRFKKINPRGLNQQNRQFLCRSLF